MATSVGSPLRITHKVVLAYCNADTLSAQAGFALSVAGMNKVRILQGELEANKLAIQYAGKQVLRPERNEARKFVFCETID